MGQKTPDWTCLPLCRTHHRELDHGLKRKTFWQDHGLDRDSLVEQFQRRYYEQTGRSAA